MEQPLIRCDAASIFPRDYYAYTRLKEAEISWEWPDTMRKSYILYGSIGWMRFYWTLLILIVYGNYVMIGLQVQSIPALNILAALVCFFALSIFSYIRLNRSIFFVLMTCFDTYVLLTSIGVFAFFGIWSVNSLFGWTSAFVFQYTVVFCSYNITIVLLDAFCLPKWFKCIWFSPAVIFFACYIIVYNVNTAHIFNLYPNNYLPNNDLSNIFNYSAGADPLPPSSSLITPGYIIQKILDHTFCWIFWCSAMDYMAQTALIQLSWFYFYYFYGLLKSLFKRDDEMNFQVLSLPVQVHPLNDHENTLEIHVLYDQLSWLKGLSLKPRYMPYMVPRLCTSAAQKALDLQNIDVEELKELGLLREAALQTTGPKGTALQGTALQTTGFQTTGLQTTGLQGTNLKGFDPSAFSLVEETKKEKHHGKKKEQNGKDGRKRDEKEVEKLQAMIEYNEIAKKDGRTVKVIERGSTHMISVRQYVPDPDKILRAEYPFKSLLCSCIFPLETFRTVLLFALIWSTLLIATFVEAAETAAFMIPSSLLITFLMVLEVSRLDNHLFREVTWSFEFLFIQLWSALEFSIFAIISITWKNIDVPSKIGQILFVYIVLCLLIMVSLLDAVPHCRGKWRFFILIGGVLTCMLMYFREYFVRSLIDSDLVCVVLCAGTDSIAFNGLNTLLIFYMKYTLVTIFVRDKRCMMLRVGLTCTSPKG